MNILNLNPAFADSGRGMRTLAHFDIEVTKDIRLYGLRLLEAPDGNRITYAAQCGNRRTATFSRALAEKMTALASLELKAVIANGTDRAA